MDYSLEYVIEAYNKLKAYIYYDNTDLLLRRRLVEFETNKTKDPMSIFKGAPKAYGFKKNFLSFNTDESVKKKLEIITKKLNEDDKDFFNEFINEISVYIYPKKIEEEKPNSNFITNQVVNNAYKIERLAAFIDAPIEVHIISVLWIMMHGIELEAQLGDVCLGNRLLLTKDKKKIVQGSGLFKPYFKQYQKWRDDSIKVAHQLFENKKDVLFLNLDVKDYYHSVRIPNNSLAPEKDSTTLQDIFLYVHIKYTSLIYEKKIPHSFDKILAKENDQPTELILPIGLLSSYVLGNYYLKDFDTRISEKVKPAYYGRYVDDILIVVSSSNINYPQQETDKDIKFDFNKYLNSISKKPDQKVSFTYDSLST